MGYYEMNLQKYVEEINPACQNIQLNIPCQSDIVLYIVLSISQ